MYKKFLKTVILLILPTFIFISRVEAAIIKIVPSKTSPGVHEQFYVDIMIDTEGSNLNGIEGSINFQSDNISFVRAESGKSIVNLWIKKPINNGSNIEFSGIITNGFDGIIDPFNLKNKLPGLITRLVFETTRPGIVSITMLPMIITLNDGLGTISNTGINSLNIEIQNINNPFLYENKDVSLLELEAYVVQDENLFDGQYALIFNAIDKQTGIKNVMIKEGNNNWQEIESPHLLNDQDRHSLISVKATNLSGKSKIVNIEPISNERNIFVIIIEFVVLVLLLIIVYKKFYGKKI